MFQQNIYRMDYYPEAWHVFHEILKNAKYNPTHSRAKLFLENLPCESCLVAFFSPYPVDID